MALSVYLLDANGDRIAHASDVHDLVDRVVAGRRATLLAEADPYGDTEVTDEGLARFRNEWQEAESLVASHLDRKAWDQINAMATRAASEPDVRLVLLGD